MTWFLKCILRFWIHGRYSSSNTNNSNSTHTTAGKMGNNDSSKWMEKRTNERRETAKRTEKKRWSEREKEEKRKKHTPYNTARQ